MNNKYWNLGKRICAGLLVLILLLSVTGCQQQKKNAGNDQASDEFWQQVQEEIEEKTEVFSNEDNSYCITTQPENGEMVNVLTQQKADGTLVQNHAVDHLDSILQVTDAYVYYETWEIAGTGIRFLWRVPIWKTEDGDQLLWEKREALLKDFMNISYITDSYMIYEDDEGIYKLNLQTKKKLPVPEEKEQLDGSVVRDRERKTVVLDGKIFVLDGNNMYSLEADSGVVKQIYTGVESDIFYNHNYLVSDDESIYFSCDHETIWQYDPSGEQAVCVITQESFSKKLKEFGLKKGKEFQKYYISELFLYQEKIYFWLVDKYGDTAGSRCVLSAPLSDLSQIENESALTDYLNEWEKEAESADKIADMIEFSSVLDTQEIYVYSPYGIEGIIEDKLILESVRVTPTAMSAVHMTYSAAYDIVSKQIIERPGIKKAI